MTFDLVVTVSMLSYEKVCLINENSYLSRESPDLDKFLFGAFIKNMLVSLDTTY